MTNFGREKGVESRALGDSKACNESTGLSIKPGQEETDQFGNWRRKRLTIISTGTAT